MVHPIPITGVANACCYINPIDKDNYSLNCDLNTQAGSSDSGQPLEGSRPSVCDNPEYAHAQAMGLCQFKYNALAKCGCPTMDNPAVWESYEKFVLETVTERLTPQRKEITLTFFASGYLLQDCNLLDKVFQLDAINSWQGNLNIHFVDFKYGIENVAQIKNEISVTMEKTQKLDWNMLAPALIAGGLGFAAIVGGTQQKKRESKVALMGIGAILIIFAIYVGSQASPKNEEEEKTLKGYDIRQIQMENENVITSIQELLKQTAERAPPHIRVQSQFHSNAAACQYAFQQQNIQLDGLLGYDIENGYQDFMNLRSFLKPDGNTIAALKVQRKGTDGSDHNDFFPVIQSSRGGASAKLTGVRIN